jgi:accessory colonization factor AcfC
MNSMGRSAAIAAFLLAQAMFASAAEIKIYSTIGVQAALEELTPKFEKASGHKLAITWVPPPCWSSGCKVARR